MGACSFPGSIKALPTVAVSICGVEVTGLVDSGSTRTIITSRLCREFGFLLERSACALTTVSGEIAQSVSKVVVPITTEKGVLRIQCVVLDKIVDEVEFLIGMDMINELGGVSIFNGNVIFGKALVPGTVGLTCAEETGGDLHIQEDDFSANFCDGKWIARWRWKNDPPPGQKFIKNYKVKPHLLPKFNMKVKEWIDNGWLKPYDGEVKSVIPLMAVEQVTKNKVRPVLDYRYLNKYTGCF